MGEGEGGLNREGGVINFPPLKRGGLLERGGLFERGGGGLNRGFTVGLVNPRCSVLKPIYKTNVTDTNKTNYYKGKREKIKMKTSTVVQIVLKSLVLAMRRTLRKKKKAENNTSCKTACIFKTHRSETSRKKHIAPIPLNQPIYHNQQNQQQYLRTETTRAGLLKAGLR